MHVEHQARSAACGTGLEQLFGIGECAGFEPGDTQDALECLAQTRVVFDHDNCA